jgi:hypothetical protein
MVLVLTSFQGAVIAHIEVDGVYNGVLHHVVELPVSSISKVT